MGAWTGLDPGGAEYLFRPATLIKTLEIFQRNEPFDRSSPTSPVYEELEAFDPTYAWRSYDKTGSFRPVFRARNVWQALGLIEDDEDGTRLTETAELLLSGQISCADVMATAAASYIEDGVRPYGVMAKALLEEPHHLFTMRDIEYGVSGSYHPGKSSISQILARPVVTQSPPVGAHRARRIRSFMGVLEGANAVSRYGSGSQIAWGARDIAALQLLTSDPLAVRPSVNNVLRAPLHDKSPTHIVERFDDLPPAGSSSMTPESFSARGVAQDPSARLLALERSTRVHQDLVSFISAHLTAIGLDPREDPNSFDIGVLLPESALIEVKSVHRNNAQAQIRKAVSQLLEYRWQHGLGPSTRLIIATNADPRPWLPSDYIDFLESLGIRLYWSHGTTLVNREGQSLLGEFDQQP